MCEIVTDMQNLHPCDEDRAVKDLSLSPNSGHFFEGTEKLLEVWFDTSTPGAKSLLSVPVKEWEDMLDLAKCQIITKCTNGLVDAYVLSESSMFVSERRLILKTCGTTKLLATIRRLLKLADTYCNLRTVHNIFYSRKNFTRPDLQTDLHKSFEREVDYLDTVFDDFDGAAYCIGSLKADRWYLYTFNPPPVSAPLSDDHTLEILMVDLPIDFMRLFTKQACRDGKHCTRTTGIADLLPVGTVIDSTLFEPCGYSMNGLLPDSEEYVTIHVTPEPDFSYVSFETNQRELDLYQQSCKVINRFRPARFLLTLFVSHVNESGRDCQKRLWDRVFPGYKRCDLQWMALEHDALIYAHYKKINSNE